MEALTIEDLMKSLSMFRKLYDIIRVIDPENMKVVRDNLPCSQYIGSTCYDFWEKKEQCNNCISARASKEQDTFIKMESQGSRKFIITASPVKVEGENYIFEMIKDITNTNIITDIDGRDLKESERIITTLNKQVVTDALTCLYNRRYIDEQLPLEIARSTKENKRFSLMMIDIDDFKDINDTYGHLAGDTVIQALSNIMGMRVRRNTDWIARYGGEEFLIFLRDADQKVAYKIAETIRNAIAEAVIMYEKKPFAVTISIGTYTVEPGTMDFKEAMRAADINLYKANTGKNRTISS